MQAQESLVRTQAGTKSIVFQDQCIFAEYGTNLLILVLYVDDLLLTSVENFIAGFVGHQTIWGPPHPKNFAHKPDDTIFSTSEH